MGRELIGRLMVKLGQDGASVAPPDPPDLGEPEPRGLQDIVGGEPEDLGSTEVLLEERESTHGPWELNAEISLNIQDALDEGALASGAELPDRVSAALQMVSLKLARIVSHPEGYLCADHFRDAAGYLLLAMPRPAADDWFTDGEVEEEGGGWSGDLDE